MYEVKVYHYRECYRRGDLEDETVLVKNEIFKTRKSAKEYIEREVRGKSNVERYYHRGNEPSYVHRFTGHTWIHENSGEKCEEYFTWELTKIKAK